MGKSLDLLKKRLNEALAPRGAVAEFCRVTGTGRSVVERWLAPDGGGPNIESLDKIAEALKTTPAELVGEPVPPREHDLAECARRVTAAALGSGAVLAPPRAPSPAVSTGTSDVDATKEGILGIVSRMNKAQAALLLRDLVGLYPELAAEAERLAERKKVATKR